VLRQARPTAVNLSWALDRLLRVAGDEDLDSADDVRQALLAAAQKLADEDVALNRRMGFNGAALVEDGDTILHHCNTGALAAVDFGTALAWCSRPTSRASTCTCWWMKPARACRARG